MTSGLHGTPGTPGTPGTGDLRNSRRVLTIVVIAAVLVALGLIFDGTPAVHGHSGATLGAEEPTPTVLTNHPPHTTTDIEL